MKVFKVELRIVDFDDLGPDGVREVIENTRYPNDCMAPSAATIETREIGEWRDDHPLNRRGTADAEYRRLFDDAAPTDEQIFRIARATMTDDAQDVAEGVGVWLMSHRELLEFARALMGKEGKS